ncbi:MAG: hypothetical protein JWP59_4397 [Massilia sp.]|nr:hypothetical protein [Massilia sp.]
MLSFSTARVRCAAVLATVSLLSACANLAGPRDVSIPLSKLQAGVEKRFPLNNKAMELFDIRLSNPKLSLQPGTDRVGLNLDATVAPPIIRQSWRGNISLSGRLSIDAVRGAVFINDPRLDQVAIEGVDGERQQQFGLLANALLHKSIRDVPVYRFRMEDLRYAGVQFMPTAIRTTADAVVIHIEPVRE